MRKEVLQNSALLIYIEQLLGSGSFTQFAASSSTTPETVWMYLTKHPNVSIRLILARNKKITAGPLAELANDPDEAVRKAAEANEQHRELLLTHK